MHCRIFNALIFKDPAFSLTSCLKKFVTKMSNCTFNYKSKIVEFNSQCNPQNFAKFFESLIYLKEAKTSDIIRMTGCQPKCKIISYSLEAKVRNEKLSNNWTSQVFVQPFSTIIEYQEEYLSYDNNDLLSSIGGSVGLFLGWSLLTIFDAIALFGRFCISLNFSKQKHTYK